MSCLYVVAIDFGTTFSGYAYSSKEEFKLNPLNITQQKWNDGTGMFESVKTPTRILLNADKTFLKFGFEAENEYAELVEGNQHGDYYYFRSFKMCLYNNNELTRDTIIEDEVGKSMPALDVFATGIAYFKDEFLKRINESVQGEEITADDAIWVITVPAIWNDKARQFMHEAAIKAGITADNVNLALEPEAAAMYCKELQLHKKAGEMTSFDPGSKFMVVDLGGGTIDVTVHEVLESGSLRELFRASGGPWGGTQIEREYLGRMKRQMGDEVYSNFARTNLEDKLFLERCIELQKRKIKPDDSGTIKLRLPISLIQMYAMTGAVMDKTMKLEDGLGISKIRGDKLEIKAEFFKSLFDKSISNIISHLQNVLQKEETSGVSTILLVGGFAESPMVKEALCKNLSPRKVIVPPAPGQAVIHGAVILGHNTDGIERRKCKYHYGIEVTDVFKPGVHPEEKRRSYPEGDRCVDMFNPILQQDQEIVIGETFIEKVFYPARPDDKGVRITLYVAEDTQPEFITDPGCRKLGHVDVPLPIKRGGTNRQITVRMSFDYSKIKVVGTDETTGKCFIGICDFLK